MRPYVVVAPQYRHTSGGIRALYTLADLLNEAGCSATVTNGVTPHGGAIVVYPEVISGNPLQADAVVRWTLNTPGHLGGDSEYDPDEFVWTWSKRFCDAPLLTVNLLERDLFYADDTPKTHDTAYFGKGHYRGVSRVYTTQCLPEITRDPAWPPTRAEVGALLRETETLYTYDDCTGIVDEALACGCRVVLLPEERELTWADTTASTQEQHDERLAHFIDATQARFA